MRADSDPLFPRLAYPDAAPALRVGDQALDYATLATACASYRRGLAEAGVARGELVAVWTHPGLATPVAVLGNLAAGVVTLPLNPGLGRRELAHVLSDAKPRLALSAHPDADQARCPDVPVRPIKLAEGSTVAPRYEGADDPDATALLLYTSGTTGAPKGVQLSQGNIVSNLDGLQQAWGLSERDCIVHALPLFHVHGLVLGLLGAMRAGAALEWIPRFRPEAVAEALTRTGGVLYAVPTMYRRLAEAGEQDEAVRGGLRAARLLVSGSAALPLREHARIEQLAGQRVVERYGLSETLINTAVRHDGERRPGTVGTPLPGVELRLVDDQRRPLDGGDEAALGEVAVRGPNVFKGYLNRPEATAAVLDADGWFYTGDLATRSADGALRIAGRKATDLIKTGGFKVGAGEVEGALLEHPAVREVAVLGAPDADLGERIVAFVVPRDEGSPPAADELADHVSDLLAKHKRPREVRVVDALPRNPMGKVQKHRLRELL